MQLIVEQKVMGVVITSSFFFKFKLFKDKKIADVQELTEKENFVFL